LWPHTGNVLGLTGMVLLALPALYAVHRAKRLHDFRRRNPGDRVHTRFREGRENTLAKLKERTQDWSPVHTFCLYSGYGCLFLSYAMRFATGG
jgi:hypothetical protein